MNFCLCFVFAFLTFSSTFGTMNAADIDGNVVSTNDSVADSAQDLAIVEDLYLIEEFAVRADDTTNATTTTATNSNSITQPSSGKRCVPLAACFKDSDCNGNEARCVGAFVGKCDCRACVSGLPCASEATCGGLHNSCNTSTGGNAICDCIKAHKLNGFANYGQALLTLCNHRDCDADSDTCFGLPCRRGRCICL